VVYLCQAFKYVPAAIPQVLYIHPSLLLRCERSLTPWYIITTSVPRWGFTSALMLGWNLNNEVRVFLVYY